MLFINFNILEFIKTWNKKKHTKSDEMFYY